MASTPSRSEANAGKLSLNQREMEVIAKAWQCLTEIKNGVPQVDTKKLAVIGGYASADSARHIWKPILNKLTALAGMEHPPAPASAKAKAKAKPKPKGTPRKRKVDADDDDEDVEQTPTKKPRAKKNTKAKKEPEEDEGLGLDDDLADDEV
ncbi:hypothetical protein F4677DRAFT_448323 [Hypoxylon crocopeplum]|nr:hypothetical protein F4677DRAFT_448323 [Hypoxylon crocopeplum]